jgi:ubiquinone biosynthesis protein
VKAASRFIRILRTAAKYRLYELLPKRAQRKARILLVPFSLQSKSQENRAVRLRLALESLGPIFVKFGQLLSTRPDLLPPDLTLELSKLQDSVTPFDNETFKLIVEQSLGKPIDELFINYQDAPLASASIAQVHAAELKSGEKVVIKVVRPGIEDVIDRDTRLLQLIARWAEKYIKEGKRLRPVEVVRNYKDTIFDELDLLKEGANASQLRRNYENSDLLYIPKIFWDYSKTNVLVLERIQGIPVNDIDALRQQNTDLKLLAERGVEIFFTQVFDHNFFHADMHPGNIFVSQHNPRSPSYIGIDTAIVGSLSREDQYYLARNLIAMFRRDYRLIAELHVWSGWVPADTSVSAFESAIRSVCEPIFQKPLKDISFGEALISLFRTAQRFQMPVQPQLVLLQKTLLNIEGLGRQLYPDLDLWETAHPYLEKWLKKRYSPKTLWRDFKYYAPEWIEKYPEAPGLLFDSLSEIKTLAKIAPELQQASHAISTRNRKSRVKRWLLPAGLIGAAAAFLLTPNAIILSNQSIGIALALLALTSALSA